MILSDDEVGWFSAHKEPVHAGVYKIRAKHGLAYCWWSGKFWGLMAKSIANAYSHRFERACHQNKIWPGLTKAAYDRIQAELMKEVCDDGQTRADEAR